MAGTAIVIGAGQIGRAVADRLRSDGWNVRVLSRSCTGDGCAAVDRKEPNALDRAIGPGADLLVDTIAFDAADARQLVVARERLGHIVAISSASVYRDDAGRTLDEATVNGFPALPERMDEHQATVAAGPETYSTRKMAMERALLEGADGSVAILRPCAIYGVGSRHPREWWVVKRLLNGRARIPLAFEGQSRFHPTAALNIAALTATIATRQAHGVFNIADESTPTARYIVRLIAENMGRRVEVDLFDGPPRGSVGRHPWAVPSPFTLSTARAAAIGYRPAGDYPDLLGPYLRWLARAPPNDWHTAFTELARYPYDLFDYAAEDAKAG